MNTIICSITLVMGSFDPLLNLFKPLLSDGFTFCQAIGVLAASVFVAWTKIRQMFADAQQDQMFDQKAKSVLVCLVFIFIIPTVVKVLESYF